VALKRASALPSQLASGLSVLAPAQRAGAQRLCALARSGRSRNDGFGISPLALWSVADGASLLSLHDDLSARDDTLV
jgi:hypothetical protein